MNILIIITTVTFFFVISSVRSQTQNLSPRYILENDVVSVPFAAIRSSSPQPQPLMIPLTLIHGADSKGAGFSLKCINLSLCLKWISLSFKFFFFNIVISMFGWNFTWLPLPSRIWIWCK